MIFSREFHSRFSNSPLYPLVLGSSALLLMVSGLVPFEVVFIPAIASNPRRCKVITQAAVVGSALGAAALSGLISLFGQSVIDSLFPNVVSSHGWNVAQEWIRHYGASALIAVSALPIAQAPALAVAGLFRVSPFKVMAAFLIGKSLKYTCIAFLVLRGERSISNLPFNHPRSSASL